MNSAAPSESKEHELAQKVLKLWERYKPLCMERLSVIEAAHAAASSVALDDEVRGKAESAAHKLAGALGSIGLPEGSKTASEIEALLQPGNALAPEQLSRLSELLASLRSQLNRGPIIRDDDSEPH
jgi:HPt (histidine-containing phosphotransfer) domain-containing protein